MSAKRCWRIASRLNKLPMDFAPEATQIQGENRLPARRQEQQLVDSGRDGAMATASKLPYSCNRETCRASVVSQK